MMGQAVHEWIQSVKVCNRMGKRNERGRENESTLNSSILGRSLTEEMPPSRTCTAGKIMEIK